MAAMLPCDGSSDSTSTDESSSSSSDDNSDSEYDDELMLAFLLFEEAQRAAELAKGKRWGGSLPGKAPNKPRNRLHGHQVLMERYFNGPESTYTDADFRRRFRMSPSLFEKVLQRVQERDEFFVQKKDCTGLLGLSALQKVAAALRTLATGASADDLAEFYEMGESTLLKTLQHFCDAVVEEFEPEYLRAPTEQELKEMLEFNARRGFPGMVGSLDCMHWEWDKCPKAWQGQFKGKEGASSVILEAVTDYRLRFWHFFFGCPGTFNDINVLMMSPLIQHMLNGQWQAVQFRVQGNLYYNPFLLTE